MPLKSTLIAALLALLGLGLGTTAAHAAPEKNKADAATAKHGKKVRANRHKHDPAPHEQDMHHEPVEKKGSYRGVLNRDDGRHFKGIPALNGDTIRTPGVRNPFGPGATPGN